MKREGSGEKGRLRREEIDRDALMQEVRPKGPRARVHPRQVPDRVHLIIPLLAHRHAVTQELVVVHLRHRFAHCERNCTEVEEVLIGDRIAHRVEDRVPGGGDRVQLVLCVGRRLAAARLDV